MTVCSCPGKEVAVAAPRRPLRPLARSDEPLEVDGQFLGDRAGERYLAAPGPGLGPAGEELASDLDELLRHVKPGGEHIDPADADRLGLAGPVREPHGCADRVDWVSCIVARCYGRSCRRRAWQPDPSFCTSR